MQRLRPAPTRPCARRHPPAQRKSEKRRGKIEMDGAPTLRNEKHVAVPLDFSAHLHTSSQGRIIRAVNGLHKIRHRAPPWHRLDVPTVRTSGASSRLCVEVSPRPPSAIPWYAGRPISARSQLACPPPQISSLPDLRPISARMPPAPDLVTALTSKVSSHPHSSGIPT
jgi:hypothetical protein